MNKLLGANTFTRISLLSFAVATTATLAACEDAPRTVTKPKTVAQETAPPATKPQPSIPVVLPPAPPPAPAIVANTKPVPLVEDESSTDDVTKVRALLDEGKVGRALEVAKVAVREQPKRSAAWNIYEGVKSTVAMAKADEAGEGSDHGNDAGRGTVVIGKTDDTKAIAQ